MTPDTSPPRAATSDLAGIPFWMPLAAALPIALCIAIMSLPDVGREHGLAFRSLYGVAYLVWVCPTAWCQRALWRRSVHWAGAAAILLVLTYAMSVANNALGLRMAFALGLLHDFTWRMPFTGLDGCWLALIAFCAMHAVLAFYVVLGRERERLVRARMEARDAQLLALRYQLNPHFLFNSLNAVSALVANRRNDEANRMIAALAEFLRATLERDDVHEHALADELALTESYLAIEQVRLAEHLKVEMRLGPDVLDALSPYLLLQPLVENAIRHGIAQRSRPGRLDILVARRGERLCVEVSNDVADEVINEVANELADDISNSGPPVQQGARGIGLANVVKRLERIYGEDFSFAGALTEEGRYRVAIAIPLRRAVGAPALPARAA